MGKIDWIDALRGYAVLGVVSIHSTMGNHNFTGHKIVEFGAKGVQLFYILSAFTLLLSHHKRNESSKKAFFLRRYFRIAPMFYLAILYYSIGFLLMSHVFAPITSYNIISHIFLLHGFSPYWINTLVPGGWSVGDEILFYIICPFLFKFVTNLRTSLAFLLVSFILGQMMVLVLKDLSIIPEKKVWEQYLYEFLPAQLFVFGFGFWVFHLFDKPLLTIAKNILIVLLLSIILLGISRFSLLPKLSLQNNFIVCLTFSIFILVVSKFPHFFTNSFVIFLGKISYSVYIIHFAVIQVIHHFNILLTNGLVAYCVRFFIILILSSILSYITFKTIELPFQAYGRRLISKLNKENNQAI